MKNILSVFAVSIAILSFTACEEVGPFIDFTHERPLSTGVSLASELRDSTWIADEVEAKSEKNVLLEEYTGVRCPNCPDGAILAESLAAQSYGRMQIVSIHSGFFAAPYPNEADLEIEEGVNIESLMGGAVSYPSATINRFNTGNGFITSSTTWETDINAEYQKESIVNIEIENVYDPESRAGILTITTHFTEQNTNEYKLSIMLLESNIIQTQDVNGVVTDDYNHKHVLRMMPTPFDGDFLLANPEIARTNLKDFNYGPLPEEFNIENMEIVAFVSDAASLYVEQVEHITF